MTTASAKIRDRRYRHSTRGRLNKAQHRVVQRWRKVARVLAVKQELGGACVDCGEDNPLILQFDHIDPMTKTRNVSVLQDMARIRSEATKCELRCANCHQLKTWYRQDMKHTGQVSIV